MKTTIGLIAVMTAFLAGRQHVQNLQSVYGDPMSNNFRLTLVLKMYEL